MDASRDYQWIQALHRGLELGLVDTSELYGGGHAEELLRYASSDFGEVYVKDKPLAYTVEEVAKRVAASAERLGRRPWAVAPHWVPVGVHDVVRAFAPFGPHISFGRRPHPRAVHSRLGGGQMRRVARVSGWGAAAEACPR